MPTVPAHRIIVNEIQVTHPKEFDYTFNDSHAVYNKQTPSTTGAIGDNKYFFEQLTDPTVNIVNGIKKSSYRSQTRFQIPTGNNSFIYPIWELSSSLAGEYKSIGRVTLKVRFHTVSNVTATNIFRLVYTSGIGTTTHSAASESYATAAADTLGTTVDSNFYIRGENVVAGTDKNSSTINTLTEFLYIYDFNKNISITDINKYFSLGLKRESDPDATLVVSVDTHVEVIN
jgi:hypothetical protein